MIQGRETKRNRGHAPHQPTKQKPSTKTPCYTEIAEAANSPSNTQNQKNSGTSAANRGKKKPGSKIISSQNNYPDPNSTRNSPHIMKQQQKHCLAKTEKTQPTSNENNTTAPKKSQQVTMKTTQHLHFFFSLCFV
jgi:hypothetical protein